MNVKIRQMITSDLKHVHYLLSEQLGWNITIKDMTRRFEHCSNMPSEHIKVAEFEEVIVGYIYYAETAFLEEEPYTEIRTVVVDEKYRGYGIGQKLISQAECWAKKNGLRKVGLFSQSFRKDSHTFYKNMGYTKTKTSDKFEKDIVI